MSNAKYSGANALTALLVMIKNKFDTKADKTDAERNVIVGIRQNGVDVAIDEETRKADIVVPTKLGDLENDMNYAANSAVTELRTTEDGRGNLRLFKADGTLAVNAYANGSGGGGEIDLCDATGTAKVELYAAVNGAGYLILHDADGNESSLSAGMISRLADLLDLTYPVGAIYLSTVSTSPASLFGGTWERLKDRFLLAAGDTYAAGATGGEATHTLTEDEMPSHRHLMYVEYSSGTLTLKQWDMYLAANVWSQIWESDGRSGFTTTRTNYAGGGAAHNNMPPYLAVYAWKRTA